MHGFNPSLIPTSKNCVRIDWRSDYNINFPRLQLWNPGFKVDASVNMHRCNRYTLMGYRFAARIRNSGLVEIQPVEMKVNVEVFNALEALQENLKIPLIEVDVIKQVKGKWVTYNRVFTVKSMGLLQKEECLEPRISFYQNQVDSSDKRWHPRLLVSAKNNEKEYLYKQTTRRHYGLQWNRIGQ